MAGEVLSFKVYWFKAKFVPVFQGIFPFSLSGWWLLDGPAQMGNLQPFPDPSYCCRYPTIVYIVFKGFLGQVESQSFTFRGKVCVCVSYRKTAV